MRYNFKASKASEQVCETFITFQHISNKLLNSLLNDLKSLRKNFDRKNGESADVCLALPGEVIEKKTEKFCDKKASHESTNSDLEELKEGQPMVKKVSSVPSSSLSLGVQMGSFSKSKLLRNRSNSSPMGIKRKNTNCLFLAHVSTLSNKKQSKSYFMIASRTRKPIFTWKNLHKTVSLEAELPEDTNDRNKQKLI